MSDRRIVSRIYLIFDKYHSILDRKTNNIIKYLSKRIEQILHEIRDIHGKLNKKMLIITSHKKGKLKLNLEITIRVTKIRMSDHIKCWGGYERTGNPICCW